MKNMKYFLEKSAIDYNSGVQLTFDVIALSLEVCVEIVDSVFSMEHRIFPKFNDSFKKKTTGQLHSTAATYHEILWNMRESWPISLDKKYDD